MKASRGSTKRERTETNVAASTPQRIQVWVDDEYPTIHAQLRWKVTVTGPPIPRVGQNRATDSEPLGRELEATQKATVDFHYRDARGQLSVPGIQAGHLLDVLTCGAGIGGIYASCAEILNSSVGPPPVRIALCALCVVAIGTLAAVAIRRNRG